MIWESVNMRYLEYNGDNFLQNYKSEFDNFKKLSENYKSEFERSEYVGTTKNLTTEKEQERKTSTTTLEENTNKMEIDGFQS